jgi:lactoylglutathione lyase
MIILHAMIRTKDLVGSVKFWTEIMNFELQHKKDNDQGRFTLVFLKQKTTEFVIELTYNWDQIEDYSVGRNFGHLAFQVDDIYAFCEHLQKHNIIINRPPRDGYMAFFKDPNNISIEILQKGSCLAVQEPWASMQNIGTW